MTNKRVTAEGLLAMQQSTMTMKKEREQFHDAQPEQDHIPANNGMDTVDRAIAAALRNVLGQVIPRDDKIPVPMFIGV